MLEITSVRDSSEINAMSNVAAKNKIQSRGQEFDKETKEHGQGVSHWQLSQLLKCLYFVILVILAVEFFIC